MYANPLTQAASSPGAVDVTGGEIQLGTSDALAGVTATIDANFGLDTNSLAAVTLGGLGGTDEIDLGNTNLTVGGDNADTSYSGDFSNLVAGSITKVGAGTWTLSGDGHNYSGDVTIDAGAIELDSADALYGSTVTVSAVG